MRHGDLAGMIVRYFHFLKLEKFLFNLTSGFCVAGTILLSVFIGLGLSCKFSFTDWSVRNILLISFNRQYGSMRAMTMSFILTQSVRRHTR